MAYKQKGCTPITAKLQKTTKAGMIQEPLLNMGSPAKQGGRKIIEAKKATAQKRIAAENKAKINK